MNQLILLGNVGNDAETHQFENNRYAIRFNLAVTESWKDTNGVKQSRTEWFRCTRYTTSPNLAAYIKKGTKLLVTGKAGAEAYVKDGQAVAIPICNVREIEFVDSANSNSQRNTETNHNQVAPQNESQANADNDDNDLPF
ncbi:single-stranded DNA-binding protein [Flavobacterium agricola]|uniref:Single-stranded DNA-binding protein n=1 Tax=Flavobacterium agricola TaxID=2870839 RepID=A0ABY6M2S1_9FLAO|nr:single-stranded DNA-binding protein [Flavobacterium agricola]UYW02070.1 single-stranded DNA-binding protein [Flavobacterium agricola]